MDFKEIEWREWIRFVWLRIVMSDALMFTW
jgi:hypothetical protein